MESGAHLWLTREILLLGMFLASGALLGMPLRPQEIEEHMQMMANAEMVQILEEENRTSGEPPM